jgi:hypothetical protein
VKKYIMLTVNTPDWCSCSFVVVGLDGEDLQRLLRRREMRATLCAADSDLSALCFWDGVAPVFFRGDGEEKTEREEAADDQRDQVFQRIGSLREFPDVFVLEGEDLIINEARSYRTECDEQVIMEEGVAWRGIPKHGDGEIASATIPWEMIEKWAKEMT